MKLTRRQLSAAAVAAIAARAQTPAPPATNLTPEAELQNARKELAATLQVLQQFEVPMSIEPAFAFEA